MEQLRLSYPFTFLFIQKGPTHSTGRNTSNETTDYKNGILIEIGENIISKPTTRHAKKGKMSPIKDTEFNGKEYTQKEPRTLLKNATQEGEYLNTSDKLIRTDFVECITNW